MTKHLLFLCLLICSACLTGHAQYAEIHWPDSVNTVRYAAYLSSLEKEVIIEMNKVRTNPKAYAAYIRQERSYYNADGSLIEKSGRIPIRTTEGFTAVDECIAALEKAEPAGLLYPEQCLYNSAALLAKDQAKTGNTGHSLSDGTGMGQRVKSFCKDFFTYGENCSYGYNQAREIVIQLLIDDGVLSRGHRDNILKKKFGFCGVSTDSHSDYRYLCVIDYAGK